MAASVSPDPLGAITHSMTILFANNMIRFLSILLVFYSTNLMAQDDVLHQDTLNGFTINIPKGWIVSPQPEDSSVPLSVRLANTSEGGIIPSYIVNIIPYHTITLEKFYNNYCRPVNSPLEPNFLVEEGEHFSNGISYKWILTEMKDLKIRTLAYYCYIKGNIYSISFTAEVRSFPKYENVFKNVVASFKTDSA